MASTLFETHIRTNPSPPTRLSPQKISSSFLQLPAHERNSRITLCPRTLPRIPQTGKLSLQASLSSPNPPASREEAIKQARTCLSTTLEKPLNNPKLAGKLKKLKQPRFRVEIPLADDSPDSLSQLVSDVFQDLPVKRKGSPVKILFLWPDEQSSTKGFKSNIAIQVEHTDVSSVTEDDDVQIFNSADVVVVLAPGSSQLNAVKKSTEIVGPKPVVLFNPKWAFDEEDNFGELRSFVGSFEVIYSFTGLEVKGILSKRKGVIFKCVRDGVVSGERWAVLVEEEEAGSLKVVSRFKSRPSIGEVETVLYNLMAINSPITKSAKFLKELVSNVTGRK
ncbi:uncharacterized protein LOC115749912 [Rhodamnia argentea]|uniref:Uncharacterized protein LOC115749912 n=1 Tax=Rhodamnia argentea TaxID=178133 RepID=A0A8B8Q8G6_9MYRT|nr:uncharacterized protein LOC115749912 [Rhodamnia argentea]